MKKRAVSESIFSVFEDSAMPKVRKTCLISARIPKGLLRSFHGGDMVAVLPRRTPLVLSPREHGKKSFCKRCGKPKQAAEIRRGIAVREKRPGDQGE